jgi:RimJ/RimL family protein N-acetyltransferase
MVTIRKLTSSDLKAFMTWGGDPQVTHSLFWDHYQNQEEALTFLKNIVDPHPWFKAICLNGTPIGAITLDQGKARGVQRAELGYVLAKDYWGKGYATEAVKLALESGFQDLGVCRIEAYVDPANLGSVKVLQKSGMEQEAYLKQYVVHRRVIKDRLVFAKTI